MFPDVFEMMSEGMTDPVMMFGRSPSRRQSHEMVLHLLMNAGEQGVDTDRLRSVSDANSMKELVQLGLCDSANGRTTSSWLEGEGRGWIRDPGVTLPYIRDVVRTDAFKEYSLVTRILKRLMEEDPKCLESLKAEIREYVKKARTDDPKIETLLSGILENLPDVISEKNVRMELANLYYRRGDFARSLEELEHNQDTYRGRMEKAGVLLRTGDPEKAEEMLLEVKGLTDVDSRMLFARTEKLLGDVRALCGDYGGAMELYRSAIRISVAGNDKYLRETVAYAYRGMVDAMVSYLEFDEEAHRGFGRLLDEATFSGFASTVHIAVQFPRMCVYRAAGEPFTHDEIASAVGSAGGTGVTMRAADLLLLVGRFEEALKMFEGVGPGDPLIERLSEHGDKNTIAEAFKAHGIADCHLNKNRAEEAIIHFTKACEAYGTLGEPFLRPRIMATMGWADALRRHNMFSEAVDKYREAHELMNSLRRSS